jgi:hypothetical protein
MADTRFDVLMVDFGVREGTRIYGGEIATSALDKIRIQTRGGFIDD